MFIGRSATLVCMRLCLAREIPRPYFSDCPDCKGQGITPTIFCRLPYTKVRESHTFLWQSTLQLLAGSDCQVSGNPRAAGSYMLQVKATGTQQLHLQSRNNWYTFRIICHKFVCHIFRCAFRIQCCNIVPDNHGAITAIIAATG
jgi:hypothetical protein